MTFDWANIEGKVNTRLKDKDMVERINKAVDKKMLKGVSASPVLNKTVEDIGREFAKLLKTVIKMSASGEFAIDRPLGPTALEALSHIDTIPPKKIGNNAYEVGVYFERDLQRESLIPDVYPNGVNNIAALLNNGYGPTKVKVRGVWHGEEIVGLQKREGYQFMQIAKEIFMEQHGKEYGIIQIDLNPVYTEE